MIRCLHTQFIPHLILNYRWTDLSMWFAVSTVNDVLVSQSWPQNIVWVRSKWLNSPQGKYCLREISNTCFSICVKQNRQGLDIYYLLRVTQLQSSEWKIKWKVGFRTHDQWGQMEGWTERITLENCQKMCQTKQYVRQQMFHAECKSCNTYVFFQWVIYYCVLTYYDSHEGKNIF